MPKPSKTKTGSQRASRRSGVERRRPPREKDRKEKSHRIERNRGSTRIGFSRASRFRGAK